MRHYVGTSGGGGCDGDSGRNCLDRGEELS